MTVSVVDAAEDATPISRLQAVIASAPLLGFLTTPTAEGMGGTQAKRAFVGEPLDQSVTNVVSNPSPNVGDEVTFTVTVSENDQPSGEYSFDGVTAHDLLPSGLTFVSASESSGSYDPSSGVWTYDITYGGTATLHITALVDSAQPQTDTATLDDQEGPGPFTASATETPICFAAGTLIRTTRGDVAVETLAVGDLVVTASGEPRPIRWLGRQTHRLRGPPRARSTWPVRVAAHAFGDNRPSRELYLSPGHSVCLSLFDEVLVPVQELVNGSTVAYVEDAAEVTYWHVELDSHDILLAENMPAESFLEIGANRATFLDGLALGEPSPEAILRTHADFCRRFVDSGPLLVAMRDELALRAERLGWARSRKVAIGCAADGVAMAERRRDGEALFAVPADAGELRISTDMMVPALYGEADARRVGVAVYAITLVAASGEERVVDLDAAGVADCFHAGERHARLHYRWTSGDVVLPASLWAGLTGPLLLSLQYEPSTQRGWTPPVQLQQEPRLRAVA